MVDYTMANPADSFFRTAGGLQQLQSNQQNMQQQQIDNQYANQQREQQAIAQQNQPAIQQQAVELLKSGTPDQIAEFGLKNPDIMKGFIQAANFKDQQAQEGRLTYAKNILTGAVDPMQAITSRIQEVQANGGDVQGLIRTAEGGAQEVLKAAEKDLAVMAPDAYKSFKTTRPESMTEFQSADLDIKRENTKLRALEAQARRMDQSLKGETNELKRQELQAKVEQANLKVETQKQKLAQTSTDINSAKSSIINEGEQVLSLLSEIENSPGFSNAVGAKGLSSGFGAFSTPIAGTAAADVAAKLETLGAKNFLASIKSFKDAGGAGALSDSEGKKLTAAMTNLSRDQTEASLRKNLVTVREIINKQIKQAQGGKASKPEGGNAPDSAVQHLMQNPNLKAAFKAKYGYLPEGV